MQLQEVSFSTLPGWESDSQNAALPALRRSCLRLMSLPAERTLGTGEIAGQVNDWKNVCHMANVLPADDPKAARAFFETAFQPWKVTVDGRDNGLFTGYYEAELHGSYTRDARYTVALLGKPDGLEGSSPKNPDAWPDRARIESGALSDKAATLLWLDDAVDAHILHIQGSGQVTLPDGSVQRVGFAASNGHPFKGLGRILIDQGRIAAEDANMPAIRAWLKNNPDDAAVLMKQNPRYVFFRLINGDGPIGAQGVALTSGRSLAVDPAFVPLGIPLWLDTSDPISGAPLRRLMVAQDTGSAIKGAIRGDFFWGSGEDSFQKAGRMKSQGSYYLLLPRKG